MLNHQNLFKNVILLLLLYLFYLVLEPFLATLVLTIVFTILTYPFYQKLVQKFKLSPTLASLSTVFGSLLFILIPTAILLTLLVNQSVVFVSKFNSADLFNYLQNIQSYSIMGFSLDIEFIQTLLVSSLNDIGRFIAQNGAQILAGLFNSIGLAIVFVTLFFYMLRDGDKLLKQFKKLLPYDSKQNNILMNSFTTTAKAVILGNLLVAIASAFIAFIGFSLVGFETSLIWAAVAFVLAFIPTLGPVILYLVGATTLYFTAGILSALLFIAYFILFELILKENYLKPKVLDSKFNAHPVLVLLSLVGGVSAFGSIGLLYGPLILLLLLTILKFSQKSQS